MFIKFVDSLWSFLIVSSPYLLLGLLISIFIHAYIPMDMIQKFLGRKKKSDVFWASLIGVPLPLCSCSVVPTSITLKKAGASNGAVSAFLISTPESGLDSILMTKAMMDLPMTILRPVAAFLSAFMVGYLNLIFNESKNEKIVEEKGSCCHCHPKDETKKKTHFEKIREGFRFSFIDMMDDMAPWLTVGIIAGALIELFIPNNYFASVNLWASNFLIILIGIPLYICASASTPIAASLIMKGLSPGSGLLFLLVGPATNISSIFVLKKHLGTKGIIINLFSIITMALIMSVLTDWLYKNYFSVNFNLQNCIACHDEKNYFAIFCAILVAALIAWSLIKKYLIKPKHTHQH